MQSQKAKLKNSDALNLCSATLEDLADFPIWAAWKNVEVKQADGSKKKIKVAICRDCKRWARTNHPRDWMDRAEAERVARRIGCAGNIGIRLGELPDGSSRLLCGIDNDNSRINGCASDWETKILGEFRTHCHLSPSACGSHVLFFATVADLKSHKSAGLITGEYGRVFSVGDHTEIAVFYGGKFLTVTKSVISLDETIRQAGRDAQEWLLSDFGPAFVRSMGKASDSPKIGAGMSDFNKIKDSSGSGYAFRYCIRAILNAACERDEAPVVCSNYFGKIDVDTPAAEWWWRATDRDRERTPLRAWDAAQAYPSDLEQHEKFLDMLDEE